MNDTISKPTDEEETVPTAKTSAADADATVEGTGPERADVWRPSNAMNPWARAFDGDSLPDEPYMGSNKTTEAARRHAALSGRRADPGAGP